MKSNTGSIVFEEYASEIRLSDDGRISVFDLIKVVGGQKNPRDVWKRLCTKATADYPEAMNYCDYLQFPGAGQRLTPVISKKGALILLGLLPGEVGSKYREDAATLMLAYIEEPEELARLAIDKISDHKKLELLEGHIESRKDELDIHPLWGLKAAKADISYVAKIQHKNTQILNFTVPVELVQKFKACLLPGENMSTALLGSLERLVIDRQK